MHVYFKLKVKTLILKTLKALFLITENTGTKTNETKLI